MLIQLVNRALTHLHGLDVFGLHPLRALEDVLDTDLVRGKRRACRPVASHTIDHEVVGKFRHSGGKINLGLGVECVSHAHAIDAFDLAGRK